MIDLLPSILMLMVGVFFLLVGFKIHKPKLRNPVSKDWYDLENYHLNVIVIKRVTTSFFGCLILLGCGGNPKEKVCTSNLFPAAKKIEKGTTGFSLDTFPSVVRDGICMKKFIYYASFDTIDCFFGSKNDTLFLMRKEHTDFDNSTMIPFFALNSKKGDRYKYRDRYQMVETHSLTGNTIEVEVLDVKSIDGDTIYSIAHSSMPLAIVEATFESGYIFPTHRRLFDISMKKGIVKYGAEIQGDIGELGFYW